MFRNMLFAACLLAAATPAFAQPPTWVHGRSIDVAVVYKPDRDGRGLPALTHPLWSSYSYRGGIPTTGAFVDANTQWEYGIIVKNTTGRDMAVCFAVDGILPVSDDDRQAPKAAAAHSSANWFSSDGESSHGCLELGPFEVVMQRQWNKNGRALKFVPAEDSRASYLGEDPFGRYYGKPGVITVAAVFAVERQWHRDDGVVTNSRPTPRGLTGTGSGSHINDQVGPGSKRQYDRRVSEILIFHYEDSLGGRFASRRDDAITFGQRLR